MPAPAFCAPSSVVLRTPSVATTVASRASSAFVAPGGARLRAAKLPSTPARVVATAATETDVATAPVGDAGDFRLSLREDVVSVACVAHGMLY
jgi:hypothetical protein